MNNTKEIQQFNQSMVEHFILQNADMLKMVLQSVKESHTFTCKQRDYEVYSDAVLGYEEHLDTFVDEYLFNLANENDECEECNLVDEYDNRFEDKEDEHTLILRDDEYNLSVFDNMLYDAGVLFQSDEQLIEGSDYICEYVFFEEEDYNLACELLETL